MSPPSRVTRRALLQAGAGLAFAAAAEPAAAHRPPPRQWGPPRDRDGWPLPAHDLAATRAGEPLRGASVRWRATFAGGVPASVAIAGGRVHVASAAGEIAALDLADGRARWRRALGTATYGSGAARRELGFFAGVALAGRRVLAASDRVHCLDAADGALLWQSQPLRTPTSDDYHWGLPTVVGELVLIGSGSGASWRPPAVASTPTGCETGRCCGAPRPCRRAPTAEG